jgi:hypothetical protein
MRAMLIALLAWRAVDEEGEDHVLGATLPEIEQWLDEMRAISS